VIRLYQPLSKAEIQAYVAEITSNVRILPES
jgi:hypothetical protein